MATLYVRKDGSGTHTQIQPAVYAAVNGDIIDIGEGTFYENVEMLGKSLTLKGAGKDKTIIQGKLANDAVAGCSYFGGESVITMPSTAAMIVGKSISGVSANTRISAILSGTQIRVSVATPTTGNISKTGVTWSSGSSTITLPSATSVIVGMKVEGTGVNALVTAYNSTTRVVSLSSPTTAAGSLATLLFRKANTGVTITQVTSPNSSSGPGSIMVTGSSDGLVIRDLWAVGFDGVVGQEAAALFFTAGAAPGHTNFLIDNCRLSADGDSAVMCGSNPYLSNGTFQNCIIDGKTFTGAEPADVPSFSTYISQGVVQSVGASSSVLSFVDMRGIIVGRTFTAASAFSGSATVTAISGNNVTINKVVSVGVGASVDCTFTLTAYMVPNCARNLFYVGQNSSPNNTQNITFKNNVVNGQTGAIISATGSKAMFNSAVTIESLGGLVENNVIDGNFGAGDNPLFSNYAIRCRQANIVVKNNINKIGNGRKNSGFLVSGANAIDLNNKTVEFVLIQAVQAAAGQNFAANMDADTVSSYSKVSSSATFSSRSNWAQVSYIYKKVGSAKRLVASFRSYGLNDNSTIKLKGATSGESYQLVKIILRDSSRNLLVLNRSEISDVNMHDLTIT